ncbi:MAG: Ig-like domain-containing protein [Treponema sp.]|uniref:Ig-like domain-containing protein n=1 Tax=Treponema sp. TaxID=166 RepID=UPI00298E9247|nr:Ig-like domain-containing protein [Treponema sp.]MBR5934380.1 Ig-like domain-containing protein [Treponema sp.]
MIRCFYFLITISTFFFTISCQNQVEFNAPIRDWFDEYANSAAIEDFKIESEFVKDKTGAVCIPSDGDKTVTLLLRNPRNYSLNMNFMTVLHDEISCEQNSSDKNIASITYSQTYLTMHDGGDPIGGNITVSETETGRPFLAFEYSLKCNTPPPSVMGQAVLVSSSLGQKYVVCFYLPTSELSSDTHKNDTHTIFIDNQQVASGTVSELEAASASRPFDLTVLSSGASFSNTAPSGCTPFYYVTDRVMHENDNLSWDIWLEDDDGLKSRTMKASTIVREAHMSVSGGTNEAVITTQESDNTTIITAAVDEGTVEEWKWESSDTGIASVVKDPNDNSIATVTGVSGGQTVINITAKLADGRIVTAAKNVRVLSLSLNGTDTESMIVNGDDGNIAITPSPTAFPSTPQFTWSSNNTNVASVNANGIVTAVSYGTAVISASASYGGKTVTCQKTINVYEVSEILGDSTGFVGTGNDFNVEVQITGPDGNTPASLSQQWYSSNTSVVPVPSVTNTNARKVTPSAAGYTDISVAVTVAQKTATRSKRLTIYDIVVSGGTLLSQSGTRNTLTLTSSIKSGNTTYNGEVDYSYTSGNTNNATVNLQTGVVTAKGSGNGSAEITITATVNGKTLQKKHTVFVISISGNVRFIKGESARALTTTEKPSGYSYAWSSENTSTAQVDATNGKITAMAKGSTTMTLTVSKGSETLTLEKTITVYELSISGGTLYKKGYTYSLSSSLSSGLTTYPDSDITYSWSSGTAATATIASATGNLSTVAGGSTVITLTANRNGTAVASITKTIYVIEVKGFTNFIVGEQPRALTIIPSSIDGYTFSLAPTSTQYVTVVDQTTRKINPRGQGNATLRLTVQKNSSDYINIDTAITISSLSFTSSIVSGTTATVAVGEEISISKTLSPSFTYSSLDCSSSDNNIATVDSNLKIKGKATGTCYITLTFTASDGTNLVKYQVLTVNVVQYHEVSYSNLDTFLQGLSENSKTTPYKLKITGLTVSDIVQDDYTVKEGTLRKILKSNSNKYVDLSQTTLPATENMDYTFGGCSTLIYAPRISEGVESMQYFYQECGNLKSPVYLPDGVKNLWFCFEYCYALEQAPAIPSSVTNMTRTFSMCTSLNTPPASIPYGVTAMNYCFLGCAQLTSCPTIPRSVTSMVSTFQGSGLSGTSIQVNANITTPAKWENTFKGCQNLQVLLYGQAEGNAFDQSEGNEGCAWSL